MISHFLGRSEPRMIRTSDGWSQLDETLASTLDTDHLTPTRLIANEQVLIEQTAIDQLVEVARLGERLRRCGISEEQARVNQIISTPDLHPGSPFPVGVAIDARGLVIPGAVGSDIGCGMRLLTFDVREDEIVGKLDVLSARLRHLYFAGGRDIPLSPRQRQAILLDGVWGLNETMADNQGQGIWTGWDASQAEAELENHFAAGVMVGHQVFAQHERWVESSGSKHGRDDQIGSLGGGNHMAELQVIDEVIDTFAGRTFGVKQGQLAVLIHSGSLVLGSAVAAHFRDRARELMRELSPDAAGQIPAHLMPLLTSGPHAHVATQYLDALRTAANFATVNRLALGLMFRQAMEETLGREVEMRLVWDAPHNLSWEMGGSEADESIEVLHRKGATPAHGPEVRGTYGLTGEPVLLPGSMGDASWLLAGSGSEDALKSASHGAGRAVARGKAAHVGQGRDEIAERGLTVVSSVDTQALRARGRGDVAKEIEARLREEAPSAYKDVEPALNSLEQAGVARRVAKLRPLLTVKDA